MSDDTITLTLPEEGDSDHEIAQEVYAATGYTPSPENHEDGSEVAPQDRPSLPEPEEVKVNMERASRLLQNIEHDLRALRQLLLAGKAAHLGEQKYFSPNDEYENAIEGVFDGEMMVDAEGKRYQVSANYASKSKLVEGDPLKLYITPDGRYFYKQLGPVERTQITGIMRPDGNRYVIDGENGRSYNVLTASVTYYMSQYGLQAGGKLVITIPADRPSSWAVIENLA